MKQLELYRHLCTEFFNLDKPTPPQEEFDFYAFYVQHATGPILEPMCGSGRYLIPMLDAGYKVDGFDASPFMLDALKKTCTEKNLAPHVWQQFLHEIDCREKYNLIFIPDSSFCLFLDPDDIMAALKKMYDCLQPEGTFVFDVETIYAEPSKVGIWQGKVHTKSDGMHLILNTLPLPVENNIATVICRYELVDKTQIIATEIEYFQIRLYQYDEMELMLRATGFSDVRSLKAYDHHNEPEHNDYTVVFECKK